MGIHDEDVVRVRESADIVAIISEYVQLKRVGRRWQGLCPFHPEKTPSFSVNAEMGLYHCFGCKASGDTISFVREVEQLDFPDAVERLAAQSGIALRYTTPTETSARSKRGRLTEALEEAVEWYHQRLMNSPDAGQARGYLRSRGLDGDTVRRYRLGWAPDEWDALATGMGVGGDKAISAQVFSDAGLGFRNKAGRLQDSFRGRVLFPIFDVGGKPVGFGGRVLPGGEGPKYKNSVDNAVYKKSRVLYGLNWAKQDIVSAGEVIVCEGYTDVIGLAQAGLARAVATCGTALTEDHVRVLRRFAPRMVLAFDADAAGQTAAERFSQWEHAFDVEVAVADLPPGADPGELSQSDPERLVAAVQGAVDFMDFRINRVLDAGDLETVKGQVRAGERAAELVAEHPNPEVKDKYLIKIADQLHLTDPLNFVNQLRSLVDKARESGSSSRSGARRNARNTATDDGGWDASWGDEPAHGSPPEEGYGHEPSDEGESTGPPPDNVERQALWLAANEPIAVWPQVVPEMFYHPLYRDAFETLLEYTDLSVLLEEAASGVVNLVSELLVAEESGLSDNQRNQDRVMSVLVYEAAQRELAYLERQARTGSADDALLRQVTQIKGAADDLRESEWDVDLGRALLVLLRPEA